MKQIFKQIEEFPEYEISNMGIVRNIKNKKLKSTKIKKNRVVIRFRKNNKEYERFLSRLLGIYFIPNPENKEQINHIDENPLNNNLSNLEWNTPKENTNHGTRNKRAAINIGKAHSKKVYQYDLNKNFIKEYQSVKEVTKDGFNFGNVAACARGERNTSKGYIWRYKKY